MSSNIKKIISYLILSLIIIINIYLYRAEITIKSDPNDNSFQYALVNEADKIWTNIFEGKASLSYLVDSFNERWNEGFSLSMYYSHLPQAIISLISKIFQINSYQLFTVVKFLFLIGLPLSFFISIRVVGGSYLFALLGAFFAQIINTDGFYGIDATSFLWRGWGLSSQLFAVFFLPLAFAYTYKYMGEGGKIGERGKMGEMGKAVIFNFIVAQSHFGIFYMLTLSYLVMLVFRFNQWKIYLKKLVIFALPLGFMLAYFIVPFFLYSQYRSFSYWDPIWKFNSFGVKQTLEWLLNGALFDYNRIPLITFLALFGSLYAFKTKKTLYRYLSILFIFYLIFFLGRAGLGGIINLIPGLSEFHLHRFIALVQFFGILLAACFTDELIMWILPRLSSPFTVKPFRVNPSGFAPLFKKNTFSNLTIKQFNNIFLLFFILISLIILYFVYKPVIKYAQDNNQMIVSHNKIYQTEILPYNKMKQVLSKIPKARIYAGRPGNWGRDFKVADISLYMMLSQDGFSIIGNAPESWSPNSEYDHFFDDQDIDYYNLYNVGYIVVPDSFKVPQFAKFLFKSGKLNLYKIDTAGWFTYGVSDLGLIGKKNYFNTAVQLWMKAKQFKDNLYPEISYSENLSTVKNKIVLTSLNSFIQNNKSYTFWLNYPIKSNSTNYSQFIENKKETTDFSKYSANFNLKQNCAQCMFILKNTYHPNWKISVNGEESKFYPVFPYYIGIPITKAGNYSVEATYKPSWITESLLLMEIVILIIGIILFIYRKKIKLPSY